MIKYISVSIGIIIVHYVLYSAILSFIQWDLGYVSPAYWEKIDRWFYVFTLMCIFVLSHVALLTKEIRADSLDDLESLKPNKRRKNEN